MRECSVMSRKRVVHISTSLRTGGAEIFTTNLLGAINVRKYKCSLITLYSPKKGNHLVEKLKDANIDYFPLNKGPGFNIKIIPVLRGLLRKLKPDILHTHMYTIKYVFLSELKSSLPPWVHTIHTLTNRELLYAERKLASFLYSAGKILPVAVSRSVQSSFEKMYHIPNINVIHNRVPCDSICTKSKAYYRQRLSLPHDATIITTVARLAPAKNHAMLIDAFNIILQKKKNCLLIIVGDGPLRNILKRKTNDLQLADKVLFPGKIINPESYLRAADIFALSSNREGLPISLLEAMRESLPIVATKAGGIPEVVDDDYNSYLVDIGDTVGFATALLKLVKSKQRTAFGKRARRKVLDEFNIQISARKYENIYQQLLLKK
ncbi:glycosyltransferase [candidate division WOR-3 bacterium]|nr:glycosyltransferase [candidate division WOR-3 bacterium]